MLRLKWDFWGWGEAWIRIECVFKKKKKKKLAVWKTGGKNCCQTGAFTESECIKEILVHLFKVDAKHSHRRVVHQRVWMFGTGGSRPNGFILTQWPRMLAHWLPVALSTGQITPQSAIHCCLSICMLFSCLVTWLFQSATSYVIFSQSAQRFRCFRWSDADLILNPSF